MDGVTATKDEINLVDGASAGVIVQGKSVVYGINGEVNAFKLKISGTDIDASALELNKLSGVTADTADFNLLDGASLGTIVNSKAVVYGTTGEVNVVKLQIAGQDVTASATELNILGGVTSDPDEINLLDGASAGNINNGKTVVYGSYGEINVKTLKIDSVAVLVGH